jgi:hypothetical protein
MSDVSSGAEATHGHPAPHDASHTDVAHHSSDAGHGSFDGGHSGGFDGGHSGGFDGGGHH